MVEQKLQEIMSMGWNVNIEGKGKGRVYEMSYEATAYRVVTEEMDRMERVKCMYPIHTVSDKLIDLLHNLYEQIKNKESKGK